MKVVILAGGRGSRLAELTEVVPKPMVQIGNRPMLWHIMKHFAHYGHEEFLLALGHKGHVIKDFFLGYHLLGTSLTVDLSVGKSQFHEGTTTDNWIIHLMETGLDTGTGGRVRRLASSLGDDPFLLTYGDGVSNVNLDAVLALHRSAGRVATVTAVRPPARFGGLTLDGDMVTEFTEKPQIGEGWINGGFMVFEPRVFDYMDDATDSLEVDVMERLARDRQLSVYCHDGFWQCMDTMRDRATLEDHWQRGEAKWKTWG
jgi:glucose-1-phosphate cytidylyltransferase